MSNFYHVVYEIEVEAETPLEAARIADDYIQRGTRSYEPFFLLRDQLTGETFYIDLEEYKCPTTSSIS
jgi:hypothetical protein